jgi:hypothetical protein
MRTGRALPKYFMICVPALLAALTVPSHALECARSRAELRTVAGDASFPLRWTETSMSDGKPLVVTISEREGMLFLAFYKMHEGLWAEGMTALCGTAADMEAKFTEGRLRAGPAAHWLLKQSMQSGALFSIRRLTQRELRIATPGWSGLFVPMPEWPEMQGRPR